MTMNAGKGQGTRAVRDGVLRSQFGEHAEGLYLTSSFVFADAAQAAARFLEQEEGYTYSRFTNPTVSMFQERLASLEGAESCIAAASGMAAILCTAMAFVSQGEEIVAGQGLFGATHQLFSAILPRFGITTRFVDLNDAAALESALTPRTKLVFCETPSNPLMQLVDLAALAERAHRAGALLAVDNTFCTPIGQQPLALGADLVIHSATKYLDGQGRVLGGAVLGARSLIDLVYRFLRTAGPSLSPFNAWVLVKSLETLPLRVRAQSEAALALARWLEGHPNVAQVLYPWLESHPQHALARRQQKLGGGVVSFRVRGGRSEAWRVIDSTRLFSITGNLGDVKSTITHPASTTHGRLAPEVRQAMGVGEDLLRLSVGLEEVEDLQADLARGLDAIGG